VERPRRRDVTRIPQARAYSKQRRGVSCLSTSLYARTASPSSTKIVAVEATAMESTVTSPEAVRSLLDGVSVHCYGIRRGAARRGLCGAVAQGNVCMDIVGYADRLSAAPGDVVRFMVSTIAPATRRPLCG